MKKPDNDLTNINIIVRTKEKDYIRIKSKELGKTITDFILDEIIPERKRIYEEYEKQLDTIISNKQELA